MASGKAAGWAYCEEYGLQTSPFGEDGLMERARERASELGVAPVHPGEGQLLRLLASSVQATSVVEIGTGAGVGSLYLLAGMDPAGVLTTIDPEFENQRTARQSFTEAGIRSARVRTIAGQPRDVIVRLTENAYDMVTFLADAPHAQDLLDHAVRLLRPGGLLAITHTLYHDRVADPATRDADTTRVRQLLQAVQESEDLHSAMVPSGDGVLAAVRRR
ncbi:MAG: O-methyltransferase [Brachybacterium sp.]|nr:O-methyltransferase [Brachybacterium sp.]